MMITSLVTTCRFLFRNLWCARRLCRLSETRFGPYVIGPLDAMHRKAAIALYLQLNPGAGLSFPQRLILCLLGSRLCLIAREASEGAQGEIVAVTLFYFNARDRRENTIHAAYNGLRPTAQGAGLGTFMLRHALAHFYASGLAGASSRVTLSNRAALNANKKAGFLPLETYFDPAIGTERHYLVCDLRASAGHSLQCRQGGD